MRRLHPFRVRDRRPRAAVRPVATQPHRQQSDVAMPKTDNVFGETAHGVAVVDADPGCAGHVLGLVDDHHRQMPLLHHRQVRVVVGRGVHDETVDPGREHGRRPVV